MSPRRPQSDRAARTGVALAWFLLFPSLGLVQKYVGTAAALAYAGAGSILLIGGAIVGAQWLMRAAPVERRTFMWAATGLLSALTLVFLVFYPIANAGVASWLSPSGIVGGGTHRDEALNLGARALLAGRYPYGETTQLGNPVSPMPGTLILALPFVAVGNVAWQNLVWFGILLAVASRLLGDRRTTLTVVCVSLLVSPVILQEFGTGGDLVTNGIAVLVALLLLLKQVPDTSSPSWIKVAAAVFAGVAFSSRSTFLLLLPLLFAALVRRVGLRQALSYVGIVAAAFGIVTLPFYWHDPAAFAPLHAQNKFLRFEAAIPGSRWLFPGLGVLFSLTLSCVRGSGTMGVWLLRCGLVLTFPVLLYVMLAAAQAGWPQLAFTSYALTGLFFATLGAALYSLEGRSTIVRTSPATSVTNEAGRMRSSDSGAFQSAMIDATGASR